MPTPVPHRPIHADAQVQQGHAESEMININPAKD